MRSLSRRALRFALALTLAASIVHAQHAGEELGTVHFPTSCRPELAPAFERALSLLHSFGYELAREGFAEVASQDPGCGMAWWGVATTWLHPLWAAPTPAELEQGRLAAERAASLGAPSERERAWIDAIGRYYADAATVGHGARMARYRDALAELSRRFPDDSEAAVFRALAMLGAAPPGDRSHAQQKLAAEILSAFVITQPNHPGVTHYLIHALDYPDLAHLGLDAARRYARIAPSSSHALHMPSHIFIRLGLWSESIASNLDSADAARRLRQRFPETASFDGLHALDYLEYAYLQRGDDEQARRVALAAAEMSALKAPTMAAAYALAAIPARYALERGDWQAAARLASPSRDVPWEKYPYAEAMTHFARALGAARLGDVATGEAELARLAEIQVRLAQSPPPGPYDWAAHVEAQRQTVAAWLTQARGDSAEAERQLMRAADLEEATGKHPVTPGSVLPARELLGDLLLALDRPREALRAYEATLQQTPNRLRSLAGAALAADRAGEAERARSFLNRVAAQAVPASERPEVVRIRSTVQPPY